MKRDGIDANPPYGEKASFRKVTVSLPPGVYEQLIRESARRKIEGEPNQLLSALLREAVTQYLEQLYNGSSRNDGLFGS
jgi:hypothetical protein